MNKTISQRPHPLHYTLEVGLQHKNSGETQVSLLEIITDKTDFKKKFLEEVRKDILIKMRVSIHKDCITGINIYTPNNKAPKFMKQKLTEFKGEIDNSAMMVGDFSTTYSKLKEH